MHNAFEMFLNHWPHIGSLVARMSVRDTVGYFDEREAFSQGEDWDWQLRLALRHRVGFVPALSSSCRVRPPGRGNEDAANAFRIRINRHIFWTNVRRAYGCRPPLLSVARARLRYDGIYAGYFLQSAAAHLEVGEHRAAWRSLVQSARISPLHGGWALVARPWVRRVARDLVLRREASRRDGPNVTTAQRAA
jgi:hypothetical protein